MRGERRDVPAGSNLEELAALKAAGYNMLVDLTCVDYSAQGRTPRFDVIYRLMKFDLVDGKDLGRVELHCAVDESPVLRSVMDLWPAADWLEREVWDMYGVLFADRPDIKRLLMYEDFKGHPLRKEYPITKRQPRIEPLDRTDLPSFNLPLPTLTGE